MNRIWRWDQGRLGYFQFDKLQLIAKTILGLDGTAINVPNLDPLRFALESQTGLTFRHKRIKFGAIISAFLNALCSQRV